MAGLRLVLAVLLMTAAVVGAGFSLHAAAFFAWVTATPISPAELAHARWLHFLWLAAVGVCLTVFVTACVWFLKLIRREERSRGFDVIQ